LKTNLATVTKYGLVGLATNGVGYAAYVLVTWVGLDPKVAITLLYPFAAIISYFGHFKITFLYNGSHLKSIFCYLQAHIVGYSLNFGVLYCFVDLLGYPHLLVQAFAIFAVAGVLFTLFRYHVFR
jgi:putative flippase GtrA